MVVEIASNSNDTRVVACTVCQKSVELGKLCTGVMSLNGQQVFACNRHLLESAKRGVWIVSWADFLSLQAKQRNRP